MLHKLTRQGERFRPVDSRVNSEPSQPRAPYFDTVVKQARLALPKCFVSDASGETVMARAFAVILSDSHNLCKMD